MQTVHNAPEYIYDAASVLHIGQRTDQQDALSKDFVSAPGMGFAVVADGMGGHAAGDVASRIVVNEVFRHLRALASSPSTLEKELERALLKSVEDANAMVRSVASARPELSGMGSTVVAPIVAQNRLYWLSVGDSPLYLLRGSNLFRLNENHSVAGVLDAMVADGDVDEDFARDHPERHCLTSVINGEKIPHVDCRTKPFLLEDHDIIIAASDGVQSINDGKIAQTVFKMRDRSAERINRALLSAIETHNDPDQDNISLCIFKLNVQVPQTDIDPSYVVSANRDEMPPREHNDQFEPVQFESIYRRAQGAKV